MCYLHAAASTLELTIHLGVYYCKLDADAYTPDFPVTSTQFFQLARIETMTRLFAVMLIFGITVFAVIGGPTAQVDKSEGQQQSLPATVSGIDHIICKAKSDCQ